MPQNKLHNACIKDTANRMETGKTRAIKTLTWSFHGAMTKLQELKEKHSNTTQRHFQYYQTSE